MPVHTAHIPVMGTGFTIDTPLKAARYGISSVIALVDDILIEQIHRYHATRLGLTPPAPVKGPEARMLRIRNYLDFIADQVLLQITSLREQVFAIGSDIAHYFELLPEGPLRTLYHRMLTESDAESKVRLQNELRNHIEPGDVQVNIMTHPDCLQYNPDGTTLAQEFSSTLLALRGFAESKLPGAVVFSAGYSPHLYRYAQSFDGFFHTGNQPPRKRIVLKVSDYRSAAIQGRFFAKLGLWVSEYRIESGINCGGHAFLGGSATLPSVLADFRDKRKELTEHLFPTMVKALEGLGRTAPTEIPPVRITVQGGIGTPEEDQFLRERYLLDGTGWGSPFLLVPEVVNLDGEHVQKLLSAGKDDIRLSRSSPLGIRFWTLSTSASENQRRDRIAAGTPGSPCPRRLVEINDEFGLPPLCTAARQYVKKKLEKLDATESDPERRRVFRERVLEKTCICYDLGGSALRSYGIDMKCATSVCCGPNVRFFTRTATLQEMMDHIYGRTQLPMRQGRKHMFLLELELYLENLRDEAACEEWLAELNTAALMRLRDTLLDGVAACRTLLGTNPAFDADFAGELDRIEAETHAVTIRNA